MYKYFEYGLRKTQSDLNICYSIPALAQHGSAQKLKSALKLQRIDRFVSFNSTDIVLDFGCGSGAMLGLLAGRIARGVGVDISPVPLANAPRLENVEFALLEPDARTEFQTNFFDKILVIDVLEHVLEPGAVIAECHRLLKSEGGLVVEVPFTGLLSELAAGEFHEGHLRYYDPDYLNVWLREQGWDVKSIAAYNSVPLSKWWLRAGPVFAVLDKICNMAPTRHYPWFGEIIAVSRKTPPKTVQ